jgi:hypothetical protein
MSRKQLMLFLRDRPTFLDLNVPNKPVSELSTDELRRLVDAAQMLERLEHSRAVTEGGVLPVRCEVCDAIMHPDSLLLNREVPAEAIDWAEWTCLRCCETGTYVWTPEQTAIFQRKLPELRAQVTRAVNRDA